LLSVMTLLNLAWAIALAIGFLAVFLLTFL
jgi:hypothetical protein